MFRFPPSLPQAYSLQIFRSAQEPVEARVAQTATGGLANFIALGRGVAPKELTGFYITSSPVLPKTILEALRTVIR